MDIVERLRERAGQYDEYGWHHEIELEAADEIERLRAQIAETRDFLRENWASREFLMSNPPKHMACYRAWEMLSPRTGAPTPASE